MTVAQTSVIVRSVARIAGGGGGAPFIPINLLTQNSQFDLVAWSKVRISVAADAANGPTGTLSADKLIATSADTDHKISRARAGLEASVPHTFSVHLKTAGLRWVVLYNAVGKGRYFDLQAGAKGGAFVGAPAESTIVDVGGGWWRCSITATAATTALTHFIYLCEADGDVSFIGNDVDGVFAWGEQLEVGSTMNIYVPG